MRIVIESPLGADTPEGVQRNYRFLLWCLRAVWLRDGHHGIASHLICPFFMDDDNPAERKAGIGWEWMWDRDVPHWFFEDCGLSRGMLAAEQECRNRNIGYVVRRLRDYHPESWAAFERGEWPPHTKGLQLVAPVPDDVVHWDDQATALVNDDVVSYQVDTSNGSPVVPDGGHVNVNWPPLNNHIVGVPANVYAVPPTKHRKPSRISRAFDRLLRAVGLVVL